MTAINPRHIGTQDRAILAHLARPTLATFERETGAITRAIKGARGATMFRLDRLATMGLVVRDYQGWRLTAAGVEGAA